MDARSGLNDQDADATVRDELEALARAWGFRIEWDALIRWQWWYWRTDRVLEVGPGATARQLRHLLDHARGHLSSGEWV